MAGRRPSWRMAITTVLLSLIGAPAPAFSQALDYYGSGYDPRDLAGTPRTPIQIYRRLVEDGYAVLSPPLQAGAVYFVTVRTPRGRAQCLVLHAFSGVILQRLSEGPFGFTPEIKDAPGPGFPGYPQDPTGRYADLCAPSIPTGTDSGKGPIRELY